MAQSLIALSHGFALYINLLNLRRPLHHSPFIPSTYKRLSRSFSFSIMGDSAMVQIGRKSSIESEPRTLRFNQIQCAREVAEFVMNTKSIEEAKHIFTKGLKPVTSVMKQNGDEMRDSIDQFETSEDDYFRLTELRDVVSAPF